jgi:3-oxoacyl-[acyl-carrier protein] reductase
VLRIGIEGKLSVITGGSRGIGRGISESLANAGSNLAIIYRKNADAFDEVAASMGALGVKIKGYQVNITSYEEVKKVFNEIFRDFGSIDILVNCAGRAPSTSSVYNGTVKMARYCRY